MTGSTIGIAVLGAGFIADYHLAGIGAAAAGTDASPSLLRAPTGAVSGAPVGTEAHAQVGAQVRMLVARSKERAAPLAAKYGIAEVVTDWRAALDRSDIDAVVVCTPDATHETIAIAAADAGKAILLQKPMAGTVAACRRIIEAAERNRVDLQVSFMHRYFPEVTEARRLLADGAIGRVESASIRNATPGPDWGDWFYSKEGGNDSVTGGVVDQLGVHGIDLAMQLIGDIGEVSARMATLRPARKLRDGRTVAVEVADTAHATYRFDSGAMGAHEMSMIEAKGCDRFRLDIYGDEGTIRLRGDRGPLAVYAPKRYGDAWHCPAFDESPFGALHHRAWLAGVAGTGPRLRTAHDALRGMMVVEAIRRSSDAHGAAVAIDEAPLTSTGLYRSPECAIHVADRVVAGRREP